MLCQPNLTKGNPMKISFATEDMKRVDAHFGWARNIMVYDLTADSFSLEKTHTFDGKLEADGNEDKVSAKIEVIKDCAIVYVADIGGPAAARVVASKVHPVKSKDMESIEDILAKLKDVMNGTPPPWLRKAMLKGQELPVDFES
jgi:nitrogen fixation protein NifX